MSNYTPTNKPINGAWNVSKVLRDEFILAQTAINSKADSLGTSSVSTTSLTIADIAQVFVMETGKQFAPGMAVYIGDAAAPATNYMLGILTSYDTTTGLSGATISSHVGSGTKTSWVIGLSNSNGATLINNTFTGHQNFARATVASAATTADIWGALGNQIDWTGTATTTAFPAAPQAGVSRKLICAGACSFTAGANMLIDGVGSGSTMTCAANDIVLVEAITTTQFLLERIRYDGKPQFLVGDHEVYLETGNGYGATNTMIRRYTTAKRNVGTAITYADSAANGMSCTINSTGIYAISINDQRIVAATRATVGISVNSAQLTTAIGSITSANRLAMSATTISAGGTDSVHLSCIVKLTAADVIRAHFDSAASCVDANAWFRIVKIADVS